MAFIQLTSPLILAGDPTLPNHPATKQYVDAKANNINAAGFTAGTLNVLRLPELTGDVTMIAGSGNLVLSSTGVAPGTYPKVTLNAQGRVTAGSALTAADMPNMSWNKITSGLPTSLAGYGISNVIGLTGGVITGMLSSTATPTNALHLVTKQYVDANIQASGDSLATGDVVRKGYTTTPSGFLRCNGSKVNKTTYAALYAVLGDRYEILYQNGVQNPYVQQESIGLPGAPSGASTSFSQATSYSEYPSPLVSFVTNNRVVHIGVINSGGYRMMRTFHAPINADGTFGTWVNDANARFSGSSNVMFEGTYMGTFIHNNRVYFQTYSVGAHYLYRSDINTDGTITNQLQIAKPSGLKNITRVLSVKNKHYFFDFDYAGTSGPLEVAVGEINSSGDIVNVVGLGQINASLLKNGLVDVFVYKNKVFVFGKTGTSGSNHLYTIYYAYINSDGTLSTWNTAPNTLSMPYAIRNTTTIVTTSGIFLVHSGVTAWFTEGEGESAYSYQATSVNKLILNTDSAGLPVSWNLQTFITHGFGHTGGIGIYNCIVVVKNRVYLTFDQGSWSIRGHYMTFSDGINSYKPYYDGSYTVSDPVNFYLPDFTSKETFNTRYFVKT